MQDKLKIVNSKIKEAESRGIVPVELYKEQLSILESAHSEFILKAQKAGYDKGLLPFHPGLYLRSDTRPPGNGHGGFRYQI